MPDQNDRMDTVYRLAIRDLYKRKGILPQVAGTVFGCEYIDIDDGTRCAKRDELNHGTWPYVGPRYGEASVNGTAVRVLFIAMERGGTFDPNDEPAFAHTQESFRVGCENRHNPHMGGTSQLVEALVQGIDRQKYSLQFSLTNAVKCVKPTGNQNSTSDKRMKKNCSIHLKEEIKVLDPHLVVTQGDHPADTLRQLYDGWSGEDFCDSPPSPDKASVLVNGGPFVLVTTPHPARKRWRWKNGPLPEYLQSALKAASGFVVPRN